MVCAEFLANYATIGGEIANFGGPDWSDVFSVGKNDGKFGAALSTTRASVKGSPVAPASAVKIKAEGDMVMYSIVVLKGQHEAGVVNANGDVIPGTQSAAKIF